MTLLDQGSGLLGQGVGHSTFNVDNLGGTAILGIVFHSSGITNSSMWAKIGVFWGQGYEGVGCLSKFARIGQLGKVNPVVNLF